jgi:hypothetical protein
MYILTLCDEKYKLQHELDSMSKTGIQGSDVQKMFDEQTKLIVDNSSKIDYRKLSDDDNFFLGDYIHRPLFDFFNRALRIGSNFVSKDEEEQNKLEKNKHSQYLRKLMAIAILCNVKNRNGLIMQTVIGLSLYAGGLRDSKYLAL